ncbi:6917_t:CDS:2 [Funneliformis caledonium]|uniref:6917_t:CDS:1 n=1 Tax=Funneliformis caledonium TaxID=1117310 RepID=A0A9N9H1W4_9GLOM|nr:6917_t:CDS:2 [Funneliformis caledonium]
MEDSERPQAIRSHSALTITTLTPQIVGSSSSANDDIISEDPYYDNELTLTGDELFRAVQKVTSANNKNEYTKEFNGKVGLEKPEKPKIPKRHLFRPTWSNIRKGFLHVYLYIMRKATWPMAKRVIKAAVAYWLAYVIDLIVPVMKSVGSYTFLAIVMVCYFQPSRTFGSLFESAGWGIIAACMATAWSLTGITLSNAVRDPSQIFDIWATIIHVSFLAVGTFVLSYDKIKWPPMRYGAINACIIMTFSLTQAYVRPHNTYHIMKSLLIPMLIGPACSLLVNITLWPEHATTNYIPYLHETLQSFIDLLDQETHFFLRDTYNRNTFAKLHRTVQDNLANLDKARQEAQHEVSFSKIGPEDILEITRLIKSMNMTLGGLALSGVIEEELMRDGQEGTVEIRIDGNNTDRQSITDQASFSIDEPLSPTSTIGTIANEEDLTNLLKILQPICTELSEACQLCLADCIARVDHLQHNCCDPWYYRWWPFKLKPRADHNKNVLDDPFGYLQEAIAKFNDSREESLTRLFANTRTISPSPQRLLLLLILFENSLKEVAESLGFLVGLVKVLSTTRQSKKFWFPMIPILKRIRNFGEIDEDGWKIFEHKTRQEEEEELGNEVFDPDVTPPSNSIQKFWYNLWRIRNWFDSKYAVFAFKNALVVTCLSLPAFLPESSKWFDIYRGQWAVVSAVLSFAPTTGGAVLQFLGRLLGVGTGAVMALIAWKMTNGNVYGLASVLFLFSLLLWFVYLNAKVWTVGGIIMLVNFPLVLTNAYQASHGIGVDDIYTIAAKRTTAVSIGITAAFVMNMIPWPHTGRVEVRHRLARTIADIGVLYSMTVSYLIKGDKYSGNLITTKPFRKLVTRINRSIAIERLLLSRTVYEPPLRGNYPMEKYAHMIEIVEHMVNLVSGIEYTLHGLNGTEWKTDLADVLNPSKCHYITHILTAFHILSTALENRVPLPPYNIVSSTETKFGQVSLGYRISKKIRQTAAGLTRDDLETPAYACYCSYLIKTSHLTNELIKLVSAVKSLVGVNRYVKELVDF